MPFHIIDMNCHYLAELVFFGNFICDSSDH